MQPLECTGSISDRLLIHLTGKFLIKPDRQPSCRELKIVRAVLVCRKFLSEKKHASFIKSEFRDHPQRTCGGKRSDANARAGLRKQFRSASVERSWLESQSLSAGKTELVPRVPRERRVLDDPKQHHRR